jgi:phosphoglycolate phosphatase-like HAD superfamily hydrolase
MKRGQKLFAWDFHGTLEQGTDISFAEVLNALAKDFGTKKKINLAEVKKMFGSTIYSQLKHFFPEATEETIEQMRAKIPGIQTDEQISIYISAAPHAKKVVSKLKTKGHKNIIVTNSQPDHIEKFLRIVGMTDLFDEIFAIDRHYVNIIFDAATEKAKAISGFSKKNNISEIVMIGDRKADIDAGHKVGATTYQVIHEEFIPDETDAHFKIKDLREILKEAE